MIIAIVLSSLALLAATLCLLLLWQAEKCRTKQKAALVKHTEDAVRLFADQLYRRCAELEGQLAETQGVLSVAEETVALLQGKVSALESGTVPDFEKAKEAANAVNDFNAGISGILGFDPMEVIRKQRESVGDV